MHGVLIVDKPAGMTSAAVVKRVKRALGGCKVGHTGTLDPMATGVLPLCIGEGTKIAGYLLAADKAYEGELQLGIETDTLDADGAVVRERADRARAVGRADLEGAMTGLTGSLEQRPPMYSAVKHGGRRLHQLAREGREVERPPRPVEVTRFALLDHDDAAELPRARFAVECSKGTYVRSLVADLGKALGCGAHLTALRRTRSGAFELSAAISLETAEAGASDELPIIDPAAALEHLPAATVPAPLSAAVRDGKPLKWRDLFGHDPGPGPLRLVTENGALLALVEVAAGRLCYLRVFTYGLTSASR